MVTTASRSTTCKAVDPDKCRYHGTLRRMEKAAKDNNWVEYSKLKEEVSQLERAGNFLEESETDTTADLDKDFDVIRFGKGKSSLTPEDKETLQSVDSLGLELVRPAVSDYENKENATVASDILQYGPVRGLKVNTYRSRIKSAKRDHEISLIKRSQAIASGEVATYSDEDIERIGLRKESVLTFEGFTPANDNQAYAIKELAYIWVKAEDTAAINRTAKESPQQKLASSLGLTRAGRTFFKDMSHPNRDNDLDYAQSGRALSYLEKAKKYDFDPSLSNKESLKSFFESMRYRDYKDSTLEKLIDFYS